MKTAHLRRTVTGVCLILWPLSMLGAALVQPDIGQRPEEVYDAAASSAGRIAASVAIGGPGVLFWIIAVAGVLHLVRSRGATLAHLGGGLALLGAIGHAVMAALFLVLLGIPLDGHRPDLLPVIDRIAERVFPVALPLLLLGGVGVVLLGLALRRAGQAPLATPVLVVAGFVSEFVPLPGTIGDIVLWCLVGGGLGAAAVRVLRLSDTQWQHDDGDASRRSDAPHTSHV